MCFICCKPDAPFLLVKHSASANYTAELISTFLIKLLTFCKYVNVTKRNMNVKKHAHTNADMDRHTHTFNRPFNTRDVLNVSVKENDIKGAYVAVQIPGFTFSTKSMEHWKGSKQHAAFSE